MILVGTVHWDLEGPRRLEHLLYRIKPESISVEFPKGITEEEARNYVLSSSSNNRKVVEESEVPEKFKQLLLEILSITGYELIVSLDYSKHTGAKVDFSDYPRKLVNGSLDGLRVALQEPNNDLDDKLAKISYEKYRKRISTKLDRGYYDPKIFWIVDQSMPNLIFNEAFVEEREQFMADQILSTRPDLHIGGVAHIFNGYGKIVSTRPLYLRLGNAVQDRIRLCEESLE